ncbi:unnamed protein product [Symbiodinium sp. CCMP2592]|nr:unnamed protein product [Symbiodinium sp. CCMP2592]
MLEPVPDVAERIYPEMTSVTDKDVDMVLFSAAQPVTFWLELGSMEGGSAIVAAQRVATHGLNISVIAADTFLTDVNFLWTRPDEEKHRLIRRDGSVSLYDRFRANIRRADMQRCVLPMLATSVSALKLVAAMARHQIIQLPQVIYLDSGHHEGEVLLELRLAWQALSPGGILFGDDWTFPDVHQDVLEFAKEVEADTDDQLGEQAQGLRTLGRVAPGVFVSYESYQWFMRKHFGARPPNAAKRGGGAHCWTQHFGPERCCDESKHGPGGDKGCWDTVYTFEKCCEQPLGSGQTTIRTEAGILSAVQASELTLIQLFCGKLAGVVAISEEGNPEDHSDTSMVEGGKYHLGPKLLCDPKNLVIDSLTGEDAARLLELSQGGEEDPQSLHSSADSGLKKSKASPVRAAEANASEAPPQLGGKRAKGKGHQIFSEVVGTGETNNLELFVQGHMPFVHEVHKPARAALPAPPPAEPPPAADTERHPSPVPAADAAEPLDASENLSYWEPQEIDMQELLLQQERNQAMEEFEQPGERDLAEPKTMDMDMDSPKEIERTVTPAGEPEPRPGQGSSWEPAIGEALEKLMALASTVTPEAAEQEPEPQIETEPAASKARQHNPDEVLGDEHRGGATAAAAASEQRVTTSLGQPEGTGPGRSSPPRGPAEKVRKPKARKVRSRPQEALPEESLAAPAAGPLVEKSEIDSGVSRTGEQVVGSSQDKACEERAVSPGPSVASPGDGQSALLGVSQDKVKKAKDKKEKKAEKAQRKRELKERLRREVEEELRLEEARRTAGPSHRPKWRPEFFSEVHLDEAPRTKGARMRKKRHKKLLGGSWGLGL